MWRFIALVAAVLVSAAAPVVDGEELGRGIRVNYAPILTPERLVGAVSELLVVPQPMIVPEQPGVLVSQQQPFVSQQVPVPQQQPEVFVPAPQLVMPQQPGVLVPQQQQAFVPQPGVLVSQQPYVSRQVPVPQQPEVFVPAPQPVLSQQPGVLVSQQQQPFVLQQVPVPLEPEVFVPSPPPPQPVVPRVIVLPVAPSQPVGSVPAVQSPVLVPQQQQPPQPGTPSGGPLPCPFGADTLVHATHRGREYHFSWCRQPGVTFTFEDAQDYCEELPRNGHPVGFNAVSIESQDEDNFIRNTISEYLVPFIWTSGKRITRNYWRWQSSIASQYNNWSHTGGAGRPQPDDLLDNENCLAVLNNFYHDGIRWHDIPCDLDKYVVCERPRPYGSA